MTAITSDAVFHAFASFIFLSNAPMLLTAYQVERYLTSLGISKEFFTLILQ